MKWTKRRNSYSYQLLTARHEANVWLATPNWVCSCKGALVNIPIDYARRFETAKEAKRFVERQLRSAGEITK